MRLDLFTQETGLEIEVDESYYDPECGNNRYRITNSTSLLDVISRISKFNSNHSRYIKPLILNKEIFIYL